MKSQIQAEKASEEAKKNCPECKHPLPQTVRFNGRCFGCLLKKFNIVPKDNHRK